MELEKLLTKDREAFEEAAHEKFAHRQDAGFIGLLSQIIVPYAHIQGKEDELSARVNAFIKMALTNEISPSTCCRVLAVVDGFTTIPRDSENYIALKERCDKYCAELLESHDAAMVFMHNPEQGFENATRREQLNNRQLNMQFLALRGTVDEYNAWLDSLRDRTRPLSRDDYTIRDSILKRMKEQATPHVIGKLLEAIGK
jgi:hypothetical protein